MKEVQKLLTIVISTAVFTTGIASMREAEAMSNEPNLVDPFPDVFVYCTDLSSQLINLRIYMSSVMERLSTYTHKPLTIEDEYTLRTRLSSVEEHCKAFVRLTDTIDSKFKGTRPEGYEQETFVATIKNDYESRVKTFVSAMTLSSALQSVDSKITVILTQLVELQNVEIYSTDEDFGSFFNIVLGLREIKTKCNQMLRMIDEIYNSLPKSPIATVFPSVRIPRSDIAGTMTVAVHPRKKSRLAIPTEPVSRGRPVPAAASSERKGAAKPGAEAARPTKTPDRATLTPAQRDLLKVHEGIIDQLRHKKNRTENIESAVGRLNEWCDELSRNPDVVAIIQRDLDIRERLAYLSRFPHDSRIRDAVVSICEMFEIELPKEKE